MVPGSERARPDDHRAGSALAHRLLEGLLPGLAGDEVPLVKERLDSLLLQPPRQFLDPGLVDVAVGWARASTPGRGITSRVPGLPANLVRGSSPPRFVFSKPVSDELIREISFENGYRESRSRGISRSRRKSLAVLGNHRSREDPSGKIVVFCSVAIGSPPWAISSIPG